MRILAIVVPAVEQVRHSLREIFDRTGKEGAWQEKKASTAPLGALAAQLWLTNEG